MYRANRCVVSFKKQRSKFFFFTHSLMSETDVVFFSRHVIERAK